MTAEQVLARVAERHGMALTLAGRCPGGEVGAYLARTSDGAPLVFKWTEDVDDHDHLGALVDVLRRLWADGYPMPPYGPVLAIAGGVFIAQGVVPGQAQDRVTHRLLDDLFAVNDRHADRAPPRAGETWGELLVRTLCRGAEDWCCHQTLMDHDSRTRRLLRRIEAVGAALDPRSLPDGDLVHFDFHHRNVLQVGGRLSAIIDWEAACPGDRIFDLVTLGTWISLASTEPGVEQRIWRRVSDHGDPGAVAAYVAHMALRRLDWVVRRRPHDVDDSVRVAERIMVAYC